MEYRRVDFRDQISRNKIKSIILMLIVFAVLMVLCYVIGQALGADIFLILIFSTIFSIVYLLISFYNSDKIAIASVGAKKSSRQENKMYYDVVEGISIASGLPMPNLYVMPSLQINAFASGRNPKSSVVCVTQGALDKLDKRELEGVVAHEFSHIANYDIRYMTFVAVMVGMISIISQIFLRSLQFGDNNREKNSGFFILIGIVLAILAPIVVWLVQMSISRKREFAADASAVQFTRYPLGLINALKKIKQENYSEKNINKALAPLFFTNPFKELGSTHPAIEKRIEILERM